ncbi:uncharacterized protein PF11_0213 isoform X2 [Photinus pyralis]|uniref:Schwannomin interacting protein 1 C-terminal domain-containing protein n=3 Tax=Photinus pyralis TaxID=7054 RepID=A0A1Y1KP00_PHOPY|nr:uncharacterized protein PF11_0213 isoform X2 [Photinus pyralis]
MHTTMRLKAADAPFSVRNGNDLDILNSPKRLNTIQNSNITSTLTLSNINSNGITTTTQTADINTTFNNVNTEDTVQWCNPALVQERELANNAKNRAHFNINNNTLAASLRATRYGTASSLYSESSPDDSLLDYEDVHQSNSSIDASPQDEDRGFDISDSESLSDEGNLNTRETLQRRGIVNPNYPGFQHLAHTLDYTIKTSSDTDFTDDDFDYDSSTTKLTAEENNINNNNEDVEYKIDSVNRLDSVENIQKVFYDKPVFNIPLNLKGENCESEEASATNSNSNQGSDDDFEVATPHSILFNIHSDEIALNKDEGLESHVTVDDLTGDSSDSSNLPVSSQTEIVNKNQIEFALERVIENELKEAIEKLSTTSNLEPSAIKYNIEPNTDQPFNKSQEQIVVKSVNVEEAPTIIQTANMAAMSCMHLPSANVKPLTKSDSFKENIKIAEIESLDYAKDAYSRKISDAFLSEVSEDLGGVLQVASNFFNSADLNANSKKIHEPQTMEVKPWKTRRDSNRDVEEFEEITRNKRFNEKLDGYKGDEVEKFCKEDKTKDDKEKDEDTVIPRKKEKIETTYIKKRRDYNQQFGSLITVPRREFGGKSRDTVNRRSTPTIRDKKKQSPESLGGFDVYNIETAMPKIDLDAIETHLRAAREEERRRRTDREEIRRRLAMGSEDDYYNDRPGRKPSLQARLQSGMNLQICFMNETASDTDSPSSDSECPMTNPKEQRMSPKIIKTAPVHPELVLEPSLPIRPATLAIGQPLLQPVTEHMTETDFFTRQARLQTEARMALAQAKEMARMQMEIERQRQIKSPITEMVRHSLEKVGIPFPEERRRLSRQILTEMNVAQLQVIVNDLHTQIETLNEVLVKFLMERDDLHMEQDSMLVDIEDLTRYLGAKEQRLKEKSIIQNNNITPFSTSPPRSPLAALNSSVKPHLHRIANFVKK